MNRNSKALILLVWALVGLGANSIAFAKDKKHTSGTPAPVASSASAASVNKKLHKLDVNQTGIAVEVPLEAIPSVVKDFVKNLGGFVEYQRVCKDTSAQKKTFQEYLKKKEDATKLVYGLSAMNYRALLQEGAEIVQTNYESASAEDQNAICARFMAGFSQYLANSIEEDKKKDLNLIDINKEFGIKSKLNADAKKSAVSSKSN